MTSPKDYSPFVPFDLYDFFGYLFPGVLFSFSLLIFFWAIDPEPFTILLAKSPSGSLEMPFLVGLAIVVCSIVSLYAIGHFIATLSHVLIDRVLVDGIDGYPFNFLLNMKVDSRPYSEASYKYLFAAFNILILAPVVIPDVHILQNTLLGLLLVMCVLVVQRVIVMVIHISPGGRELTARLGNTRAFKLLLLPSNLFIDPAIDFLRKLLGLDRRFPDAFITHYKAKFRETFDQLEPDKIGSENYWLSAFHARARSQIHEATLHTWLHLYGFARNASAAFYLSASLVVAHLYFNPQVYSTFLRLYLLILLVLAAGLGVRYWILYSHYYSKGVFRAFVESTTRVDEK